MKTLCALLLFAVAAPCFAHTEDPPECIGLGAECVKLTSSTVRVTPAQVILTDDEKPAETAAAVKESAQTESVFLKFLGALITMLTPVILLLAKNWRDAILAKKDESKLNMGIGIALQLFTAFLTEAQKALTPKLKEALADGVVTPAERDDLVKTLVNMALTGLPSHVMSVLTSAFGTSLQTWLSHQATETVDAALAKNGAAAENSGSPS